MVVLKPRRCLSRKGGTQAFVHDGMRMSLGGVRCSPTAADGQSVFCMGALENRRKLGFDSFKLCSCLDCVQDGIHTEAPFVAATKKYLEVRLLLYHGCRCLDEQKSSESRVIHTQQQQTTQQKKKLEFHHTSCSQFPQLAVGYLNGTTLINAHTYKQAEAPFTPSQERKA